AVQVDVSEPVHAPQDPVATGPGALGVAGGIVGGRGLGEAGDHGQLRQGQLCQRPAIVGLGGSGDAVGAIAEKDLVAVQRQNGVLVDLVLDPQGQQDLV